MASWLDTCCMILERRLPERLDTLDEDDREEHPWWKCKKWALHILIRTFERHGSPANLPKGQTQERVDFANFFLKGFSGNSPLMARRHLFLSALLAKVIGLVFVILEAYRHKIYVSPRVIQLCLNYLRERFVSKQDHIRSISHPFLVFVMLSHGRSFRTISLFWFKTSSIHCSASATTTLKCSTTNLWNSSVAVLVCLRRAPPSLTTYLSFRYLRRIRQSGVCCRIVSRRCGGETKRCSDENSGFSRHNHSQRYDHQQAKGWCSTHVGRDRQCSDQEESLRQSIREYDCSIPVSRTAGTNAVSSCSGLLCHQEFLQAGVFHPREFHALPDLSDSLSLQRYILAGSSRSSDGVELVHVRYGSRWDKQSGDRSSSASDRHAYHRNHSQNRNRRCDDRSAEDRRSIRSRTTTHCGADDFAARRVLQASHLHGKYSERWKQSRRTNRSSHGCPEYFGHHRQLHGRKGWGKRTIRRDDILKDSIVTSFLPKSNKSSAKQSCWSCATVFSVECDCRCLFEWWWRDFFLQISTKKFSRWSIR